MIQLKDVKIVLTIRRSTVEATIVHATLRDVKNTFQILSRILEDPENAEFTSSRIDEEEKSADIGRVTENVRRE